MPIPEQYRRQLVEHHATAEREARHATRADMLRTARDIGLWTLLGLLFLGFALGVDDEAYGRVFWWAGAAIWFSGVTFSVLAAYRRGERRGDW